MNKGNNRFTEVGDSYERKNYEYKIVAKVPHESMPGHFVCMVARREFGFEEYSYFIEVHKA